jgi:toxin HigB-1
VLRSFRDKETGAIWHRQRSRRLDGPVQRVAWRKLAILDAAETCFTWSEAGPEDVEIVDYH